MHRTPFREASKLENEPGPVTQVTDQLKATVLKLHHGKLWKLLTDSIGSIQGLQRKHYRVYTF